MEWIYLEARKWNGIPDGGLGADWTGRGTDLGQITLFLKQIE